MAYLKPPAFTAKVFNPIAAKLGLIEHRIDNTYRARGGEPGYERPEQLRADLELVVLVVADPDVREHSAVRDGGSSDHWIPDVIRRTLPRSLVMSS